LISILPDTLSTALQ